jgi:hypothetical protein
MCALAAWSRGRYVYLHVDKDQRAAKYHYTSEPLAVDVSEPDVTVTARVSGDFPGSPVNLQYRFTLESASIARLEITA